MNVPGPGHQERTLMTNGRVPASRTRKPESLGDERRGTVNSVARRRKEQYLWRAEMWCRIQRLEEELGLDRPRLSVVESPDA